MNLPKCPNDPTHTDFRVRVRKVVHQRVSLDGEGGYETPTCDETLESEWLEAVCEDCGAQALPQEPTDVEAERGRRRESDEVWRKGPDTCAPAGEGGPGCPGYFCDQNGEGIQRCDECRRFEDDYEAACHAEWVSCKRLVFELVDRGHGEKTYPIPGMEED